MLCSGTCLVLTKNSCIVHVRNLVSCPQLVIDCGPISLTVVVLLLMGVFDRSGDGGKPIIVPAILTPHRGVPGTCTRTSFSATEMYTYFVYSTGSRC